MAVTSPKLVTSGFYRVHLWVLMGLNTLAALVLYSQREQFQEILARPQAALAAAFVLTLLCYGGAVVWLYERSRAGLGVLWSVAGCGLLGAIVATPGLAGLPGAETAWLPRALDVAELISGGATLGATLGAMFLGHWYLNTPTMQLLPLRRLIALILLSVLLRAAVSGIGLALVALGEPLEVQFWIFVAFRWLSGIVGTAIFAVMAWYALAVPNTQSATGILYAAVVVVFLGELTAMLLSVDRLYPL